MRQFLSLVALLALSGCLGHSAVNNELIGQIKKIKNETHVACPETTVVEVSLGVVRNGTGSMSGEDIWLYVPNDLAKGTLQNLADRGALVKIVYDIERMSRCHPNEVIQSVTESKGITGENLE